MTAARPVMPVAKANKGENRWVKRSPSNDPVGGFHNKPEHSMEWSVESGRHCSKL